MVNQDIGAGGMQRARDLRPHAPRCAGDQRDVIAQGKIVIHNGHAAQRYPNGCGGAK